MLKPYTWVSIMGPKCHHGREYKSGHVDILREMRKRVTTLLVSILLISAGPVLLLQSVQLEPPVYSYNSKMTTGGDIEENTSVSISSFSSRTYLGLRTTETRRQVVKRTIRNGEHESMTFVRAKKAVEYEGNYYRITTSTTGGFSNLLLLVMAFEATLGIISPLVGVYLLYRNVF